MRRCPRESEDIVFMAYIQGEGRNQGILFPVVLDDFVPADHLCRVIERARIRALPVESLREGIDDLRPRE